MAYALFDSLDITMNCDVVFLSRTSLPKLPYIYLVLGFSNYLKLLYLKTINTDNYELQVWNILEET